MKAIQIANQKYFYDKNTGFLFYDRKGNKQVPFSIFGKEDYITFLKQIR